MNILMMTNTFTPIVGGLEKSVQTFSEEYRKRGHRVIIVAPRFEGMPEKEDDVIRLPAVQNFNGTDFSVQLPIPGFLKEALEDFRPDIIHSHHPFLVGDTAMRAAYQFNVPLVYTNHTLFEYNTHYVSDSETLKRFAIQLSAGYANLADQVFAPSEGIRLMLEGQGVESPIAVVPTGIDEKYFSGGDGQAMRRKLGIPERAFVAGYVGRLAPEKNLEFLAQAVALFLEQKSDACFLIIGKGPLEEAVRKCFASEALHRRLFLTGILDRRELADAYRAMDVFVFASQSETQGVALMEAMAAGVPVVAVDACAVRDVVSDGVNGMLLKNENAGDFSAALKSIARKSAEDRRAFSRAAVETASHYSKDICAEKALAIYSRLMRYELRRQRDHGHIWDDSVWAQTLRQLRAEWELLKNMTRAATSAVRNADDESKATAAK